MKRLWLAAVFTTLGLSSNAFALEYDFTAIDFPGAQFTQAQGINDSWQIVGNYTARGPSGIFGSHGFLFSGGQFSTIDHPTGIAGTTGLRDINNDGVITGVHGTSIGVGSAFVKIRDQFIDIVVPFEDADFTTNLGINDAGHLAGTYAIGGGDFSGFIFKGNDYFNESDYAKVSLGPDTMLDDINNLDQFVGTFRVGNGDARGGGQRQGFFFDGNSYVDINFPGAFSTEAMALNDAGVIAGFYTIDSISPANGFLFDGEYHAVDVPFENSFATAFFGINNSGQLVGQYADNEGLHGLLATPVNGAAVPEPSEFILFGMAMAGVGAYHLFLSGRKRLAAPESMA